MQLEKGLGYAPGYIGDDEGLHVVVNERPYDTFKEAEDRIPEMLEYFSIGMSKAVIICFKILGDNQVQLIDIFEFKKSAIN